MIPAVSLSLQEVKLWIKDAYTCILAVIEAHVSIPFVGKFSLISFTKINAHKVSIKMNETHAKRTDGCRMLPARQAGMMTNPAVSSR